MLPATAPSDGRLDGPLVLATHRGRRDSERRGDYAPTTEQWIAGLQGLLGRNPDVRKRGKSAETSFSADMDWHALNEAEPLELGLASANSIGEVLRDHPWLVVCERIAERQGFFHWNLDFATVFARGGFDLQVGNPPWVRPRSDVDALLAEGDPWWQLAQKPSQSQVDTKKRVETLALAGIPDLVIDGTVEVSAMAAFCRICPTVSIPSWPST